MAPIAFIGIMAVVIFAIVIPAYRAEKKRTESMRRLAEELSLEFFANDPGSIRSSMQLLPLFSKGRRKTFSNIIRGQTDDLTLSMFGYRFTIRSGKSSSTHSQTVVSLQSPQLNLPTFQLSPEHVFHRIAEKMGYQDIDFESHPDFSRQYLLRGDSETQIRQAFTHELIVHLEMQKDVSIEATGNQLIYYRAGRRASAESLKSQMAEAFQVYRLLRGSTDVV